MKNYIKEYLKEFKCGTKNMFKEFFYKETNKKQRANMWTFTRLVIPFITLIICVMTLFVTNTLPLLVSAAILTGIAASTDYFDGKSARKYGATSEYGKLLDQVADKVFSGLTGICVAILNPAFLINLLGEVIIASVNLVYKKSNPDLNIKSSKIGKIKEWPLFITLGLGFISKLNPVLDIITKILIMTTFAMQMTAAGNYIKQNEKEIKKMKSKKELFASNELRIDLKKEENTVKEKTLTKENRIQELKQYKEDLLNNNTCETEKILKLK